MNRKPLAILQYNLNKSRHQVMAQCGEDYRPGRHRTKLRIYLTDHGLRSRAAVTGGNQDPTRTDEPSTIGLVFGTRLLSDCIVSCGVAQIEYRVYSIGTPRTYILYVTSRQLSAVLLATQTQ
jgi:hypothetical protein